MNDHDEPDRTFWPKRAWEWVCLVFTLLSKWRCARQHRWENQVRLDKQEMRIEILERWKAERDADPRETARVMNDAATWDDLEGTNITEGVDSVEHVQRVRAGDPPPQHERTQREPRQWTGAQLRRGRPRDKRASAKSVIGAAEAVTGRDSVGQPERRAPTNPGGAP